jgi:hypothetical protein
MAKLDINQLLNNSIMRQSENNSNLALNLESVDNCPGCGRNATSNSLALNLENVAFQERVQQYIGEDVVNNIKGALGAGLATFAVLEARHS